MKIQNTKNTARRAGFTLVELLVVIAIIAALAGLATPVILRAQKAAAVTEATNNAKQIGTFLFLFNNDYGTFPSEDTATKLTDDSIDVKTGTTSNAYLSQLIAADYTDSEEIFYAKAAGTAKPDGVINTTTAMLDQGECGFAYVMLSGDVPLSTSYSGGMAVLCAPMKRDASSTEGAFDDSPYDSKAVYLRLDQSVQQKRINNSDNVAIGGGNTLFDTGAETVWDDEDPDLKFPDVAGG